MEVHRATSEQTKRTAMASRAGPRASSGSRSRAGKWRFLFHRVVVPFTLLLRLLMGWIFLWAGFDKAINGFSAEGFLTHATSGPLHGWFTDLGASATALSVIEPLVTYGQILMGFAIFFGAATRSALSFAGIMMFLHRRVPGPRRAWRRENPRCRRACRTDRVGARPSLAALPARLGPRAPSLGWIRGGEEFLPPRGGWGCAGHPARCPSPWCVSGR